MKTVSFQFSWYNGGHFTTIYDNDTEKTIFFSSEKVSFRIIGTAEKPKEAIEVKIGDFKKQYVMGEITFINGQAASDNVDTLINHFRTILLD
jgi:hypothetical protein